MKKTPKNRLIIDINNKADIDWLRTLQAERVKKGNEQNNPKKAEDFNP